MHETLCENECTRADGTPHLATHGRYCTRCWGRLNMPLSQSGELVIHLLGSIVPATGQASDKIDASKDAPLPFNRAAFDDANELFSMLVYWCMAWADNLETKAPEVAKGAWRKANGKITGLPANIRPAQAGAMVDGLARWLQNRLDTILATIDYADDIEAFTEQIGDVWRMNARWPRIDRPAYSKMPCPRDECKRKIVVYPPTFEGDDRRIVCQGGHWYPEEEYEHLILVLEQHLKEQAQTEQVVAHLMEKYGDMLKRA